MRIGLLSDIHECSTLLAGAIARCRCAGAERLVLLGDVFQSGDRFEETVAILREARVEGVWGNHEFGICHEPDAVIEAAFGGPVLDYMLRLRPRMELEGILFGHVLPSLEPTDIQQPWYVVPFPESAESAAVEFTAFPHRRMFIGHYHRWAIVTPDGPVDWRGERPFAFSPVQRYLAVVAAVCDGFCALYDTENDLLTPLRIENT